MFSIVVPTCNRIELLRTCLGSVAPGKQTLSFDHYEVIITDDGSVEEEKRIQEDFPWSVVAKGPRKGPSANRNNGARYARGMWLAFIDDDCIADAGWLEGYWNFIKTHPQCEVLEGRTYVNEPRASLAQVSPLNATGGYLWSCNFSMEGDLFRELGGFDERFPYAAMEDVELRTRILKSGRGFEFVPEASVLHPWRDRGGWRKHKEHQESTLLYLSLHPEQSSTINSWHYLERVIRYFLKFTVPGIFQYRGKGLRSAMLEHCADIRMVFILFFRERRAGRLSRSEPTVPGL